MCKAEFLYPLDTKSFWYHDLPEELPVMVKLKQVIHENLMFNGTTAINTLPHLLCSYRYMSPHFLIKSHQDIKLKEITHREILDYREDSYGINQTLEYDSDNIDGVKIYE